jgi:hypothetical protein
MDFQKIIDYVAEDWDKFMDRARNAYEETIDIGLDQIDTWKKLDDKIKYGIIGGIGFIVLVVFLVIVLSHEVIPVTGSLEQSEVLGGDFIVITNESEEIIAPVTFLIDDMYIYKVDELTPLVDKTIFLNRFHHIVGNMEEGDTVNTLYTPYTLKVICPMGEKEIELIKKKGWFQ